MVKLIYCCHTCKSAHMTYDVIQNGAETTDGRRKKSKKSLLKAQDTQDYELRSSASKAKNLRHTFSFAIKKFKKD